MYLNGAPQRPLYQKTISAKSDMSASCASAHGLQYRSEDDMRTLLRSLKPALEVRPSSSHGRNDCLTDSILLAMEDQGLIRSLDIDMRVQLCTAVRRHLVLACDLSPHSYPFRSHDEHFE